MEIWSRSLLPLGFLALGLGLAVPVSGQQVRPAGVALRPELSRRIDSLYARYDRPHTAGGVIAVLHRGEVIHLKAYGAAQREFNVRWTPDTRYRLASITKSLVSTAVAMLERQGKLRVDDPVRMYLPDFPELDGAVTLDHLLTMTSGLWQDETLLALASLRGALTVDDMYRLSQRQRKLNFPPGSANAYTDTNYRLLARIIAVVTGKPFWEAVQDLVFRPLGMTASLADPSLHHFYDNQAPTYLGAASDTAPPLVNVPFQTSGDGSVITTMNDLIRWLRFLRADRDQPGSLFQWMTTPFNLADGTPAPYRRGIATVVHRGMIGWAHGGFTGTYYVFWPELDLIVTDFANQLGAISPERMAREVTDLFLESEGRGARDGSPVSQAWSREEPRTGPLSGDEVRRLSGVFIDSVSGYVLASEPLASQESIPRAEAARYNFLGTEVRVAKAMDGSFVTPAVTRGLRLRIRPVNCDGCADPDLEVLQTGWTAPRRYLRVRQPAPVIVERDYLGHYDLQALGAQYTVAKDARGLTLSIGAGIQASQVLRLTPLARDVFWAQSEDPEQFDLFALGRVSLRFERAGGRVRALRLSTDRVRDLELVKTP